MPNKIAALVQILKADPDVSAMVGARVWPHEIPDNMVAKMPTKAALLIRPAGGTQSFGSRSYMEVSDSRVDVQHYAWSPSSAFDLYTVVHRVLQGLERAVAADTILHWCNPAGGPIAMRNPPVNWPGGAVDPRKHWPFVLASWQVLAADRSPEVVAP